MSRGPGRIERKIAEAFAARPFDPAKDMTVLAQKVKEMGGVDLLVIDPFVAAVPASKNSHNNAETRSGLQPVKDFAEEAGVAVVGVTHFSKGSAGQDPIERVTGSLAFGAVPRIIMAAARSQADGPPRIFVRAKTSIGVDGGGFGYDLQPGPISHEHPDIITTRVVWMDPLEGTARELLEVAEQVDAKPTKLDQAKALLQDMLAKHERKQTEVVEEAARQGISLRTLKEAKKQAEVKSDKRGADWFWRL
jgi:putative DNA primase/helicase